MVIGMAKIKVTVTLDDQAVQSIHELVAKRQTPSVSGFVQHAVSLALQDVAGWNASLAEALDQTGGPLTDKEREWVDSLLVEPRRQPHRRRRKHAA